MISFLPSLQLHFSSLFCMRFYGPEGVHVIAFSWLGLFPRFGVWHFTLGRHNQVKRFLLLFYARELFELSCGTSYQSIHCVMRFVRLRLITRAHAREFPEKQGNYELLGRDRARGLDEDLASLPDDCNFL